MALTAEQIAIVKSTAPIVKEHGMTITTTFYKNLLAEHPELKNYFSLRHQQVGTQQRALADSVFAYAAYIDNLPKLSEAVERIAQKHASLFIKAEHYPIVGKFLVAAFAEVLGSALTAEIADAWIAAYGQLADIFIQREKQLYDEHGDWRDWRRFTIVDRKPEADDIVSFYLAPSDKRPLPLYRPGQYVTLQLPIPELDNLRQNRQFSLSAAPCTAMTEYRITVKREHTWDKPSVDDLAAGRVPGVISNLLHDKYSVGDEVELSAPQGDFFLDAAGPPADSPVVLLSIGVGATPLVAILDAILASPEPSRPVSWIHAARRSGGLCFNRHVRDVAAAHPSVKPVMFVKNVGEGDKKDADYHFDGRMDLNKVAGDAALHLADPSAHYYLCGLVEWMLQTRDWLENKGVAPERIHLELFGTGSV